jgi:hypothetical protein
VEFIRRHFEKVVFTIILVSVVPVLLKARKVRR